MMAGDTVPLIRLYTRRWCGYCYAARRLLERLGARVEEIDVGRAPELRRRVAEIAGGWRTLPMIFVGDDFIGGYRDLARLRRTGDLDRLLRPER